MTSDEKHQETLRQLRSVEDSKNQWEQAWKDERTKNAKLARALPDPTRLRLLAAWLDIYDENNGYSGPKNIQATLRAWANAAEQALGTLTPAAGPPEAAGGSSTAPPA